MDFVGIQYATHILLADVRLADPPDVAMFAAASAQGAVIVVPFGDGWHRAIAWDRLREHVPLPMSEMRDTLESGRHPVNVGHLVMGIAFLGLAVVWSLIANDVVEGRDVRWLMPVPWVLAGAGGLVAAALTTRRRHAARQVGWVAPDEVER